MDRLQNAAVGSATADVAVHMADDLFIGGFGLGLPQQRDRGQDHSRRAVAALKCFCFEEGLLYAIQVFAIGESFDGGDVFSCRGTNWSNATADRISIQQNRASAALALAATVLGASQLKSVAENIQEGLVGGNINLVLASIHNNPESHGVTSQERVSQHETKLRSLRPRDRE